mmetsp:Transcript_82233/g.163885  ORF Transcript_82233/g.163885 Transcript_82233/m.163885 type:complete len:190 (-) Transcript_82233:574-1143(-)
MRTDSACAFSQMASSPNHGGYISRQTVDAYMRDIPALREVLQESNAMRVQLEQAKVDLAAERASIVDLKAEATRLVAELAKERASVAAVTAERDAAIKTRDAFVEIARGTTTFACSGAAVLGAHTDYAVTTMFPAMLAGAIQLHGLRDKSWKATALVLGFLGLFSIVLLVGLDKHAYTRGRDRTRRTCA